MTDKELCKECGGDLIEGRSIRYPCHDHGLCFTCYFWLEKLEWHKAGDPNAVVVDGTHYHIGPETTSGMFKGFGGRRFEIEFFNGRKVTTTNLWCQVDIPESWRERLPNNARFLP